VQVKTSLGKPITAQFVLQRTWTETRPSLPVAPDWKAYRPLLMVLVSRFRRFAVQKLVAIEAIAVYCRGREAKMEVPD